MIVLDTNILSELMRPSPAEEVRRWLTRLPGDEFLITTVITVYEIEYGLKRLPDGQRRQDLEARFLTFTGPDSQLSILPFVETTARLAGQLRALRESMGLTAQSADMMIAAITLQAGAALATRNSKDFGDLGLELINPWQSEN